MQRRDAWTLKALRALLACLCVVLAFPGTSAGEPTFRPVAAAVATASAMAAPRVASRVARASATGRAVSAAPPPSEARFVARMPRGLPTRDGRKLYLEKRSLLC